MRAQSLLGSPPVVLLAFGLARIAPRALIYALVRQAARWARRRENNVYRTLRDNLSHVVPEVAAATLDQLAEDALYEAGCTYFDTFHHRASALLRGDLLTYSSEEWDRASAQFASPRGTIVVGPHISNYDLAAQWFSTRGFQIQTLSLRNPSRGVQMVNRLRQQRGLIVTPISVDALRKAVRRLRAGGAVLTGVDRPASYDDPPIEFFGKPAPLPRGHVRLAMQTDSPIIVAYCHRQPDNRYRLRILAPLEMERSGDRERDVEHNTRRVLALIEDAIREAPSQWTMLLPVWQRPEDMERA